MRGFLPYSLIYTTTITKSEAPRELAYTADGDLVGSGGFMLKEISAAREANGSGEAETEVTIDWNVDTKGKWLNRLAPVLKWLFAANHNYVMRRGERGLAQWLAGVKAELPEKNSKRRQRQQDDRGSPQVNCQTGGAGRF